MTAAQTLWRIDLPWITPPISLNDRGHWATRSAKVSSVRITTGWLVKAARIPAQQRIRVTLHYRPGTARRRDADNLTATYKPACDAIVDAGVVPDDSDEFVQHMMPVIHPKGRPAMWLDIEAAP